MRVFLSDLSAPKNFTDTCPRLLPFSRRMLSCAHRRARCSQITLQEWATVESDSKQFKWAHGSGLCILSAALFAALLWRTFSCHIFGSPIGKGFYCWLVCSFGMKGFEMNSMCSKDFQSKHVTTGLKGKWEHIKWITNEYCICTETFVIKHTAVDILLYLYLRFFVSTANVNVV